MQPNHSDPVVEEIREVRHRISERCDHDPARLVAHYLELQECYRERLRETPPPDDQADEPAA